MFRSFHVALNSTYSDFQRFVFGATFIYTQLRFLRTVVSERLILSPRTMGNNVHEL